ncbi:heterokaryon incompatibility protein-domain-containing protein [Xylaria arbuscula]|nr:heterokaryon incompatibility protein-domain-containing protein [Xylaria arbuscula]
MRLINVKTLRLEEFHHNIPPYAILMPSSHTPRAAKNSIERKAGYAKIIGACNQAKADRLAYLWCDTNCIDKSSSAELTEAINSMYAWYRDSVVCYAYLADVRVFDTAGMGTEEFRKSRWFTRGWTLQELIAPKEVRFFNVNWKHIGNRQGLGNIICEVTHIHRCALGNRDTISDYSIAQRMSWAAGRKTSRQEDIAYCLLGIFDINMPLLYGEGPKAFTRLQEEIIKVSVDQSIFAWDLLDGQRRTSVGILALSPDEFASCGAIVRDMNVAPWPYTTTNLGVSIDLPMIRTTVNDTVLGYVSCCIAVPSLSSLDLVENNW